MRHWGSTHHSYLRWLIIQSREIRLLVKASWYHSAQHIRTTNSSMCRKLQAIWMNKSWTGGWLGGHVNHMAHMNWRFEFWFSLISWCTNITPIMTPHFVWFSDAPTCPTVVSHSHYIICTCTRHEVLTRANELFKLLFRIARTTCVLSDFSTTSLSTPIGLNQCCCSTQKRMQRGRTEDCKTAVNKYFSQRGCSFPSTFVHSYFIFHVPIWLHMFSVVTDLCIAKNLLFCLRIAKNLLFCMDWPLDHPLLCAFVFTFWWSHIDNVHNCTLMLYLQQSKTHWLLCCIDFKDGNIQVFDSLAGSFNIHQHKDKVNQVLKYVECMHQKFYGKALPSKWQVNRCFWCNCCAKTCSVMTLTTLNFIVTWPCL